MLNYKGYLMPYQIKGMILGIENMGGIFVKRVDDYLFFDIPKGSDIDDDEKIKKASDLMKDFIGYKMKIKRV